MFLASPATPSIKRPPLTLVRFGVAIAAAATLLGAAPQPVTSRLAPELARLIRPDVGALVSRSVPAPAPNLVAAIGEYPARLLNDTLPFSRTPIEPAAPLLLSGAATASRAALECLTQAVYYEAASEPDQGQRAVAQVVLNRVRHPSFPNSVCGVVYQGSERQTGCQFTFTCDGSLRKSPSAAFWLRARQVAESALRGRVEASVGMATHYHTDWVFPYWAPNLKKITKVGTHIFYGWTGSWGRRAAFTETAVAEPLVEAEATADMTEVQPDSLILGSEPAAIARVRLVADSTPTAPLAGSTVARRPAGLLADERAGALHVDQDVSRQDLVARPWSVSGDAIADPAVRR
jgi:hypothetical protein